MTDKERILMAIIQRVFVRDNALREKPVIDTSLDNRRLKPGDLVCAISSIWMNPHLIGFVEEVKKNSVVIREIGSNNLCDYSNEWFAKIDKEHLGYEILEGTQYKLYETVRNAFAENCIAKFKDISFDGNVCTIEARRSFDNVTVFSLSFPYDDNFSKEAVEKLIIEKEEEYWKREKEDCERD